VNVGTFIRRAAAQHGSRTAVRCRDETLRYAEVCERATRLANALHGLGVPPDGRVGVVVPNCLQSMEIEFGCAIAGVARVSLNVRLTEAELARTLLAMDVHAVIYAGRFGEVAARVLDERPGVQALRIGIDPEDDGGGPGSDYEDALTRAADTPPSGAGDPALYCLFCTSGTTGAAKGVMLTHEAQLAVAGNLLLEFGNVKPADKILLPQPLSHGGGFFMLPWYLSGGECVIVDKFDPIGSFEVAERHDVDAIKLVPTMLIAMMAAGVTPTNSYRPRHMIYGASPIPRDTLTTAIETFGPVFAQLYGQAEAPMCITVLPKEDHVAENGSPILTSAGRPWRNVDVRVVDEDDADVQPGERGEVIVRGAHMMQGYFRDPEQTAQVLRDGYVRTRDMATVDERGYIYLLGRMDDMINSGGFNVPPLLVENVLNDHPAVVESAAVGVPDERWGERVKAFVVLRGDVEAQPDELIEFCRPRLGMQRPRDIEILPELPKNAYGKVIKSALRSR
jgi:acyl-CoA synthetase (AMP-forming)/AMP-acid ligase II